MRAPRGLPLVPRQGGHRAGPGGVPPTGSVRETAAARARHIRHERPPVQGAARAEDRGSPAADVAGRGGGEDVQLKMNGNRCDVSR